MSKLRRNLGKAVMNNNKDSIKHYRSMLDIMEDKWLPIEQALVKYGF
jgi:hypothetical protein